MSYVPPPQWEIFEAVVIKILQAQNFVFLQRAPREDAGFDWAGNLGLESWAIEVKYYRTARAQPALIEAAATRLLASGLAANKTRAMLVVSCFLPPYLRDNLQQRFNIVFVDRLDLEFWAASNPEYAKALDGVLEPDPVADVEARRLEHEVALEGRPIALGAAPPTTETRGAQLCAALKAIKRGREQWAAYEQVCSRILRYLFENDLYGWHEQKRTDDGLSRYDFICRVRPTTEFWKFLIEHLNSRYVLFEFKNYRSTIKQGQILTTEKYLLERALRRVAIIITRVGGESNAIKMAEGAMREHGKLMLIINDECVCDMLHMKDRGEDPSDRLFDAADDFMLTLPR